MIFKLSLPSSSSLSWAWCSSRLLLVALPAAVGFIGPFLLAAKLAAAQDPPPPNVTQSLTPAAAFEAARVQAFLESRYKPSDVTHSFRTKLGDTIDCIDFFAQPGVQALAAQGTPLTSLPAPVRNRRGPDAVFDGAPDENGQVRQCPDGNVPQVRITAEQIQRAGGLDAYLSHQKKYPFHLNPRMTHGQLRQEAPPEPGLPGFAHTLISGTGNNYTSTQAAISIWRPAVPISDATDHSLMQTWTITGANQATAATATAPAVQCAANCVQSVEAGWIVDPGLNFDANPHLFIYSTPDGYWSGCYNGSVPANIGGGKTCASWIGFPSSYPPGVTLPSSVSGDQNQLQQIYIWVGRCSIYNECQNGWEVRVSPDLNAEHYVGVGYYPDSDFNNTFTAASTFQAGSEVFEQAATPSDTLFTLPMGSGAPATAGLGQAAYVANAFWTSPAGSGTGSNGGFGAPLSTVTTKYGVWQNPNIGNNEIDLGIDYYLGAPAPPPPPPPPPPPCPANGPSADDQFYANPNNSPVQVEQGGVGIVNLLLDGSWISADHGNDAVGQIVDSNLPAGSAPTAYPASADNSGHSYALMEFYVSVPFGASPGSYMVTVRATDVTTCVAMTTAVPIQILSCNPETTCSRGAIQSCGAISDGCGGTVKCGACPSGQTCSGAVCCPTGTSYSNVYNTCVPSSCPVGTSFCYETGGCATDSQCKERVHCHKVGKIIECE
jgi:hypothetical protein